MNTRRLTKFAFVLAVAALIAGLSACDQIQELLIPAPPQMEGLNGEISIGLVYPATGRLAPVGMEMGSGFELALEEINKSQLGNTKLKFITEDDQSTVEGAVEAFNKLIHQDGVSVILGPASSSATEAAFPIAQQSGVVAISATRRRPRSGRDWRLCVSYYSRHRCADYKRYQGNACQTRLPESGDHI